MAKSGRAFADRKKVQSITADITLEKVDCGTYMMLNVASVVALLLYLQSLMLWRRLVV